MKLVVISHTEHFINSQGEVVGWGPTVIEINHLLDLFEEIVHIAVLNKSKAPKSASPYCSDKIKFVPLKKVGGNSFSDKINILREMPHVIRIVNKILNETDYFQLRTPTAMGVYLIPYLILFSNKKGWFKYAGNWHQKNAPLSFIFQRKLLKKQKRIVTINGKWENQKNNLISFENPSLNINDRTKGAEIIKVKKIKTPYNYCFVGELNDNKGIKKIVSAIREIKHKNFGVLHVVGDGVLMETLQKEVENFNLPIKFYGLLSKNEVRSIYEKSHFIILASLSEGFPKVIGEGMNYGCIPIVSKVSCIDQYVQNNTNGFLIEPITISSIKDNLLLSLEMSEHEFSKWIHTNYKLSNKFTYEHYNNNIKSKILKIE
jgi:glycosyltransferase involved in cell wall biosynthesis